MSDIVKRESETGVARVYKFEDLEKMAEVLAKSKMFGAWDTKDKVLALLLISQTEGGNPCVAVQRYFPITNAQGQTATGKWAKAMLIDFLERGGKIKWLKTTHQIAQAEFSMAGREPYTMTYTWEEAVRAKLVNKSNWSNHPTDMLCNAVISKGLRRFDPASTSFMCSEAEGVDTFNDNNENDGGEGEKKPAGTPPQELFGVKGKGKKAKEEKTVEVTVITEEEKPQEGANPATVAQAMENVTIPPVEPKSEPVSPTPPTSPVPPTPVTLSAPIAEETEYTKLMKTLPKDKLLGFLVSIKYIKQGEGYDKVSVTRQQHAVKNFAGFKAKVEAYVPFGTEG